MRAHPGRLDPGQRRQDVWRAADRARPGVDPQVAAAAADILQQAVSFGTGTGADIGRPQIGKTGTDDGYTDAWFVGAVPQLSAAVWIGFPQGQIAMDTPRTRITVFGGTWPADIWRTFMTDATARPARAAVPDAQGRAT